MIPVVLENRFGAWAAIASHSNFKSNTLTPVERTGNLDTPTSTPKPVEHSPSARLIRDSALELVLTFALLFGVATIVRWVIGPSPISRAIPEIHAELWIVGAAVALLLSGLILSPPGRISGAHTNPAISLAMWRFGVFPGGAVIPYTIAQLLGSVLGVIAARGVWGPIVADPPVVYAALQPAAGWSTWELFATEAAGMAVIVFLVGLCLAVERLTPFVPWIIGALVGTGIAVLGTASGGSLNPARQFGPAIASGQTRFLWVYLLAPMVGAAFAAWLRWRVQNRRKVLTHRLCGTVG
jgi:glycerol uptake facilitator-like aquaporin